MLWNIEVEPIILYLNLVTITRSYKVVRVPRQKLFSWRKKKKERKKEKKRRSRRDEETEGNRLNRMAVNEKSSRRVGRM